MATNDEPRFFEYLPNVNVNAAFIPRAEIKLTPEQVEAMRAQYGPSPIQKALPAMIAVSNYMKRIRDNDR